MSRLELVKKRISSANEERIFYTRCEQGGSDYVVELVVPAESKVCREYGVDSIFKLSECSPSMVFKLTDGVTKLSQKLDPIKLTAKNVADFEIGNKFITDFSTVTTLMIPRPNKTTIVRAFDNIDDCLSFKDEFKSFLY